MIVDECKQPQRDGSRACRRKIAERGLLALALFVAAISTQCLTHPFTGLDSELVRALTGAESEGEDDDLFSEDNLALLAAGLSSGAIAGATDSGGTTAATKVVLFSGGQHMGNLGGIAGADAICGLASANPGLGNSQAFLASSAQNLPTIAGVPTDVPVEGPAGDQIAANWAALFSGPLDLSFGTPGGANVIPGNSPTFEFLVGSDSSGVNNAGNNCSDWTNSSPGDNASVGNPGLTSGYLDTNDPSGQCAGLNYLVCIGYAGSGGRDVTR